MKAFFPLSDVVWLAAERKAGGRVGVVKHAPCAYRNDRWDATMHLLNNTFGAHDMRALYDAARIIPTSETGDIALIRSHIAYWAGQSQAEAAKIFPSRGHSYRFDIYGKRYTVRITDYYDHRDGVVGFH